MSNKAGRKPKKKSRPIPVKAAINSRDEARNIIHRFHSLYKDHEIAKNINDIVLAKKLKEEMNSIGGIRRYQG